MPDDLDALRTIRAQTLQLLTDVTAQPKPTYSVDGQSVAWEAYLSQLRATLDWCDAKLAAGELFEISTPART